MMRRMAIGVLSVWLALGPAGISHGGAGEGLPKIDVKPFTDLRMAYAKSPHYAPYASSDKERIPILDAYRAADYPKALSLSKAWLEKCPVDIEIHKVRALACSKVDDLPGYFYHSHFYYGLLASITASGDGRTADTAWKVISVAEEHDVIRHMGARVVQQGLLTGLVDMMECERAGKKFTLFFDVSIPMGTLNKEFKKKD